MDAWRQKREIARREFASELRGDLSQEEEQLLQARLTSQKAALAALRLEVQRSRYDSNYDRFAAIDTDDDAEEAAGP